MRFKDLPIGTHFYCNGNLCEKRSTRTACLLEYSRVFYFGQRESVAMVQA